MKIMKITIMRTISIVIMIKSNKIKKKAKTTVIKSKIRNIKNKKANVPVMAKMQMFI